MFFFWTHSTVTFPAYIGTRVQNMEGWWWRMRWPGWLVTYQEGCPSQHWPDSTWSNFTNRDYCNIIHCQCQRQPVTPHYRNYTIKKSEFNVLDSFVQWLGLSFHRGTKIWLLLSHGRNFGRQNGQMPLLPLSMTRMGTGEIRTQVCWVWVNLNHSATAVSYEHSNCLPIITTMDRLESCTQVLHK